MRARIIFMLSALIQVPALYGLQDVLRVPFDVSTIFAPSGWMGDGQQGTRYLSLNTAFRGRPRNHDSDGLTTRIAYSVGPQRWAGIYWQYPDSNWGTRPGRHIVGASAISFWAAGETGREVVEFKAGGIPGKYHDSFEVSMGKVILTTQWKHYNLSLKGSDTSTVIGAFCVVLVADPSSSTIVVHLDEIEYE